MIQCLLADARRLEALSPAFAIAVEWLSAHNPARVKPGRYELAEGVFVNCEEPALRPASQAKLETHRRYADIHVPILGPERIGLAYTSALSHPVADYDADRDIRFFTDEYSVVAEVKPGEILVVFPEDAHAPNIGAGPHRKLCVKIPV